MAKEFDMTRMIVPPSPGLFSAVGLLVAEVHHHDVRSVRERANMDAGRLDQLFTEMEEGLRARLADQRLDGTGIGVERLADMRYVGQSSELRIAVPSGPIGEGEFATIRETFDGEHERTYGHRGSGQRVEIVNLRLRATAKTPASERFDVFSRTGSVERVGESFRDAYFGPEHGVLATPVIGRPDLNEKARRGPLIVEEMDATTVVPPGAEACLDELGNILISL